MRISMKVKQDLIQPCKFAIENRIMLQKLITPAWKRAADKFKEIHIGGGERPNQTTFDKIHQLVNDANLSNTIPHFLKAIRKLPTTADNLLKYAIFLHTCLSHCGKSDMTDMNATVGYLIESCDCQIGHETTVYLRTTENTSREEEQCNSKEIILMGSIVKPFLGFLQKLISQLDQINAMSSEELEDHQAWMLINLLKMMTAFSSQFTLIGRYFMKNYGYLIILLTEAVHRDVRRIFYLLKGYIKTQNCLLSCSEGADSHKIEQFMRMVEEITDLNEKLYQMYLGKYFYAYLRDLHMPYWINTNSEEFDTIYKLWASIQGEEGKVMHSPAASTSSEGNS